MATVSFLWHLHQPAYRTADGVSHAPWTALHAGGAYTTLAAALLESGARGQVLNIVPTLLEQLIAYRDRAVRDPVLDTLTTPAGSLTDAQRRLLVAWIPNVTPRQLSRYPRLAELIARGRGAGDRVGALFTTSDLRDAQVLFILAQAGEQAWRDERLAPVRTVGHHFSADDHARVAAWLAAQPGEVVERWRRLAERPGVEISTSPYAHPILPLLIDTEVVVESWAPHAAPAVPSLQRPEDAARHLADGLEFMRRHGFDTAGCWPPEGSVSADAARLYAAQGVRWLVTDEGILERSLDRPLRDDGRASAELYTPWRLLTPSPVLLFRDRWLSDRIGFTYGRWEDEGRAALSLVRELEDLARTLRDDAAIVLALDGENPWLHYPEGGGRFLRELMGRLAGAGPLLRPATLAEVCDDRTPVELPRLHPGSWINSVFATWIGHPEKTRAWELLGRVREAVARPGRPLPSSLLLAEGSDWFWWLGDDNPTPLAPLYDRIFRMHLHDACREAGCLPPADLDQPLKTVTRTVQVPRSEIWPAPRLDGRISSYFEWSLAARVEADTQQPLQRLALRAGGGRLYLLVEARTPVAQLLNGDRLAVRLTTADGAEVEISDRDPSPGAVLVVDRVAEASLPWDGAAGARLEVRLGASRLPEDSVLLLERLDVDEEPDPQRRRGG